MLRKTLLTVSVLLLLCGVRLQAQNNQSNMEAYAFVFKPIILDKTSDLNFGSVTVGNQGGSVVIAQNGNRSKTGDVGLVQSNFAAASVTITAHEFYWVTIDFPAGTVLTSGSNTLEMTFNPSIDDNVETGETGILTMLIGGTVTIPASAPVGEYTGNVQLSVVYF